MASYHSLTFVYFKPFPELKYTASPDWSKKFVEPMNIGFTSNIIIIIIRIIIIILLLLLLVVAVVCVYEDRIDGVVVSPSNAGDMTSVSALPD